MRRWKMQVSTLPEGDAHPAFPGILRLLERARTNPAHDVFDPAIDTLWIAFEGPTIFGAATTRLTTDGIAELRLAAGTRHREWIALLDSDVTAWARLCQARRLTMVGRKGWARYARAFGWVVRGQDEEGKSIFTKEL